MSPSVAESLPLALRSSLNLRTPPRSTISQPIIPERALENDSYIFRKASKSYLGPASTAASMPKPTASETVTASLGLETPSWLKWT